MRRPLQLAVIGAARAGRDLTDPAREVGRRIAEAGAVLVCGGRGGVMQAASAGARAAGGVAIGILPGADARHSAPNEHLHHAIFTGMGQARNQVIVLSAAAVIAIGGGWGTLNEIALALKNRRPVVTLHSWRLERPDGEPEPLLQRAETAEQAVELALASARAREL